MRMMKKTKLKKKRKKKVKKVKRARKRTDSLKKRRMHSLKMTNSCISVY